MLYTTEQCLYLVKEESEEKPLLDPKNDLVFKKIFGRKENEDILISFLNAILVRSGNNPIKSVDFTNTTLDVSNIVDEKIGILDIRVITDNGSHVNVEIQLINQYNMIKRTLFYWSRLYSEQINKGVEYRNLNKTITINILNFNYLDIDTFHSSYHLYEDRCNKILSDIMEVHFIELPKFIEEHSNKYDPLSKWIRFLMNPEKEELEEIMMSEPAIKKAHNVLRILSSDPETRYLAELRQKAIWDNRSNIEGAKDEGRQEGIQIGIEKGEYKGRLSMLIKQLTKKFGEVPNLYVEKLSKLTPERMDELALEIFDLNSIDEINKFL